MRAVVLDQFGGPEVLRVREIPSPSAGPEEVLIKVFATALNRADLLEREGKYPPPGNPPRYQIPGLECAGEVIDVGDRVTKFKIGDRVMALLTGGGYAEYVTVHEQMAMTIPDRLGWSQAAAVPEAFLTAFDALFNKAEVSLGDRVMIHAGASGVGSAAIQLAKAVGARVLTTVGSVGKAEAVMSWGADRIVLYRSTSFLQEVKVWTRDQGVHAALDFVGQRYFSDNLMALSPGGTLVIIGTLSGTDASIDLGLLLARRLTVRGTVLRSRPVEEKMRLVQDFIRRGWPFLDNGQVKPVVDRQFSLDDAAEAHRYMATNQNIGKIVIAVGTP